MGWFGRRKARHDEQLTHADGSLLEPSGVHAAQQDLARLEHELAAADPGDEAAIDGITAQMGAIEDRIRQLEQRSVQAPVRVDEHGRVEQLPLVERIQQAGERGIATVVSSEAIGETDEKRSFYLEVEVASGLGTFQAGMRLHIRRTSPARVQGFAQQGATFAVRFDPATPTNVVLDPSEVQG